MIDTVQKVMKNFDISFDRIVHVEECFVGHISRTFFVTVASDGNIKRYVLQRMNEYVFPNIDILMNNVGLVTEFIRKKTIAKGKNPMRATLCFHKSLDGKYYFRDEENYPWRMYDFIEGASTYDACPSEDFFSEVGRSFGMFSRELADFDASILGEVIPKFHDTSARFDAFLQAVLKDEANRANSVQKEIEFVKARKATCDKIVSMLRNKEIPLRVTHNDTKLNNILVDDKTKKGVCVIDLDTVMPGSVLYDFGDAIRFGASTASEDETDLSKVHVDINMFRAFAVGYVGALKGYITEKEILLLPLGALVITLETGIRFLTDYLNGDKYFHISRTNHNLDRARNQFKLVEELEQKQDIMSEIVQTILG